MATKRLVVIGGAGALGRGVVSHFTRASWKALSVDFAELVLPTGSKNEESASSFVFNASAESTLTQASDLLEHISKSFGKVDAVVCTAGGWAGGSVKDADSLANLAEMHAKNTESAVLAAHLAANVLNPRGLLVLTGAAAALKATPGMVSYGISKAATHHLIASTVDALPDDATVLGVLPATIDTPTNRMYMANADFSTWTSIDSIAAKIHEWAVASPDARPNSGHLVTVLTKNHKNVWADVGNPFLQ
ncbi:hypothetical protein ATCC90586_001110 [Pythium insidiosum]|nr:hypothetical protein ATCC90586_001110 [Pythium insidiosum]